jgi:hypothetical protein
LAWNGSVFGSRDDFQLICRFAAAHLISVGKHFRGADNIEHPRRRDGYNRDSSHTSDIRLPSILLQSIYLRVDHLPVAMSGLTILESAVGASRPTTGPSFSILKA